MEQVIFDTNGTEYLCVERKKVQEYKADVDYGCNGTFNSDYDKGYWFGQCAALDRLFGNKCLPEKEEPKPKFKVGDLALVKDGYAKGSVITIKAINIESPISYKSDIEDDGIAQWFLESML